MRVTAMGAEAPDGAWRVSAELNKGKSGPIVLACDEVLDTVKARAFAAAIVEACEWIEAQA